MTEKEKIELVEEIMDVDEGTLEADMLLTDIEEWDSLSSLALIVEVKKRWGRVVTTDSIMKLVTVQDICDLFEAEL